MNYSRFEDLPVWKEAINLASMVDDFIRSLSKGVLSFTQKDQLERASLSVSNNIAEGFERRTTKELIAFIFIAKGSAGEVRSLLLFLESRPYLIHLKTQIVQIKSVAESCSKQLGAWASHLRQSTI